MSNGVPHDVPSASAPGVGSAGASLRRLAYFGLSIILVSAVCSWAVRPLVPLPWWKIFRRCVSVASAVTLLVFMWRVHGQSLGSLGLGPWKRGKAQLIQGLVIGFWSVFILLSLNLAIGACRLTTTAGTWELIGTLLAFLPAAALVSVLEELIFRGYILQQLLACSRVVAVIASSAVFALVHMRLKEFWLHSLFELTGLFLLGGVLALSTLRTKQLYLAIGLHAALAYWVGINKLVVEFPYPSLQWVVGTSRVANGMIPWLVLLWIGWVVARGNAPTPKAVG